jgi:isoleucyl-tRNA synthetase
MFRPVSSKPDLVAQEHEVLTTWRERRTFARLRAQNAGNERWSFLDGPITANNPMGVHHAWGRAYKDLFQRFWAMHGRDQRYQNGFDCQGLWVEVNVEKDLGFTSKRDIEAYGIAEFVSLCKQRVLTYAARQTEQSIRLGMWMDWNDPVELRRLRDLLAENPSQMATTTGPDGKPITDTVEQLVGRLGMPEMGGSYFTFSNENNYLIWSFIAECHRRGWLYKGHDTMPWCARCGTGISQHEMTEGYADREDPGLTVKFPLLDRPGEALLVWTTTPWTLTSNVAAAVGADLRYVKVKQGDELFWLGRGTLKAALEGPFQIIEEKLGRELAGWRYAGPFDELEAVEEAFAAVSSPDGKPYEHRVVVWDEVGEEEGTGIVHIAPGCGAEDFALGKSLGLPMIAPLDESGIVIAGFGPLTGRDVRDVKEPILESLKHKHRFYRLETITHRYPHCWRCGTGLVFRLVDEWYISMGPVYDKPRSELTAAEVDASLRYQIMEVIQGIKWIPGFGYERELDWLLNMHDWMISKKRYWGLALPIYDCECGTINVVGGREELAERAAEGWSEFEGHTPHRPHVDAVKIRCSGCGKPVSRIRDVGNPWLDAGIVPFSTMHYRSDPDYWKGWFPADFVPRPVPQLVLLASGDEHGSPPRGAVQDALRLRPRLRRGWPADAQELGQRHRVRRSRRADGRRCDALDVRQRPAGRQHLLRLARRRRSPTAAVGPVERLLVLRDVRSFGRLEPEGCGSGGRRARPARSLDPGARGAAGQRGGVAAQELRRSRCGSGDRRLRGGAVDVVSAPFAQALRPRSRRNGSCRCLLNDARHARGPHPNHGAHSAVLERVDVPEPRGWGRSHGRSRQRPLDELADR